MVQRGSRKRSTAEDEIFSPTTTFMIWFRSPKFKLLRFHTSMRRRCRRCYGAGLCQESGRHRDLQNQTAPRSNTVNFIVQ
jgi:hypothetical protein